MKTDTHQIARSRHTALDLPHGAVARIVLKDGARFDGKAEIAFDDGALVLAYADGTSVALAV